MALVKQWEELVLEHGWAYGSQGHALEGKRMLSLINASGGQSAYEHNKQERPTILARACDYSDAHDLLEAGVTHVFRDGLDSCLRIGADALHLLGFRAYQARRAAQQLLRYDEEVLRELTGQRQNQAHYLNVARQRIAELEQMLLADLEERAAERDAGWDAESLRQEYGRRAAERARSGT